MILELYDYKRQRDALNQRRYEDTIC